MDYKKIIGYGARSTALAGAGLALTLATNLSLDTYLRANDVAYRMGRGDELSQTEEVAFKAYELTNTLLLPAHLALNAFEQEKQTVDNVRLETRVSQDKPSSINLTHLLQQ